MDIKDIQSRFTYHPSNEEKDKKYQQLRLQFLNLAILMDELCPDSREKSLAMTDLENSLMWIDKGISRN